ncbi:DUF192 domain-containing protein [Magnetospirillum sp. SS-4]|uniref:DUF192 domain-containing protein n=1 Tax=Magnetospirillum sp. SS-4 TaxID=2681465 RepID=UPI0013860E84|nr:DUF192 domain-containing protein [Magnetospirillum sp. SS-4]CAA7615512.1 conserved hypothetical protein [Magnetospirillum sp. SS-4]
MLALTLSCGGALAESPGFARSSLEVVAGDGRRHPFTVEMAISDSEKARGLMFRETLAGDAGMLFDFGRPRQVAMWMKNTLIPLDMLFIEAGGTVIHIEEGAVPGSLEPRGPTRPVLGVLELAGGTARRLGLRPGDRVEHPMFSRPR